MASTISILIQDIESQLHNAVPLNEPGLNEEVTFRLTDIRNAYNALAMLSHTRNPSISAAVRRIVATAIQARIRQMYHALFAAVEGRIDRTEARLEEAERGIEFRRGLAARAREIRRIEEELTATNRQIQAWYSAYLQVQREREEQRRLAAEQRRLAEEQHRLAEEQHRLAEEHRRLAEGQTAQNRAQEEYNQRSDEILADQRARQGAGESMFIQHDPHWFWQCHICGHLNELYAEIRHFSRGWPSAREWQTACINPANNIVRSNSSNSASRVEPNDHICGHDRCGWCIDLDENMTPVRYGSGAAITQADYAEFWGWRFWAERHGMPHGEVTWEEYEMFCVHRFGGVPPLMPQEGIMTQDDELDEQSAGQESTYPEL